MGGEKKKETDVYVQYTYIYIYKIRIIIIISRKINETQVIFEVAALTPPPVIIIIETISVDDVDVQKLFFLSDIFLYPKTVGIPMFGIIIHLIINIIIRTIQLLLFYCYIHNVFSFT